MTGLGAQVDGAAHRPVHPYSPRHRPKLNQLVLALLRSPLHGLANGLCELRYQGPHTGRIISLPVGYARDGDRLVVLIGDAPHKRWWRTFDHPHPIQVRLNDELHTGTGRVVHPDHPSTTTARTAYLDRHHVAIRATDRLLLIDL